MQCLPELSQREIYCPWTDPAWQWGLKIVPHWGLLSPTWPSLEPAPVALLLSGCPWASAPACSPSPGTTDRGRGLVTNLSLLNFSFNQPGRWKTFFFLLHLSPKPDPKSSPTLHTQHLLVSPIFFCWKIVSSCASWSWRTGSSWDWNQADSFTANATEHHVSCAVPFSSSACKLYHPTMRTKSSRCCRPGNSIRTTDPCPWARVTASTAAPPSDQPRVAIEDVRPLWLSLMLSRMVWLILWLSTTDTECSGTSGLGCVSSPDLGVGSWPPYGNMNGAVIHFAASSSRSLAKEPCSKPF